MTYTFGNHELDTARFELRREGVALHVEPQVFDLLVYLIERRDRVVRKHELLDGVWADRLVCDATVSHCIMCARKAVDDDGRRQRVIRTLHRRGYRFVAPVLQGSDEYGQERAG
jgi:DNA-binding winged helix-turn-helix (wHTH) protein